MEEHEVIKTFQCPRDDKDKKYHVIGVIKNLHFTIFSKKNEGIDESRLSKELEMEDYYLTVFYSNSEDREDIKIEFRNV